jgi:hypothetical protein
MAYAEGRFGGRFAGVETTGGSGQHFAKGDFFAGCVFWGKVVEVGSDEAAV